MFSRVEFPYAFEEMLHLEIAAYDVGNFQSYNLATYNGVMIS
jgi:hypothetical protein